jgi:ABC-type transport system substrate-binding protein
MHRTLMERVVVFAGLLLMLAGVVPLLPAQQADPPAGTQAPADQSDAARAGDAARDADAPADAGDADEPQPRSQDAGRSLPTLARMELPDAEQLLRGERLDWVVLKDADEHVIVTEPVTPRPDTLVKMRAALEAKLKERKNLTGEALEQYRRELEQMAHLQLNLPGQIDETLYEIHIDKVSRIIHHEDQMLMRVDRLIEQENFELGYELLNVLRRVHPDWPGAAERHARFLLAEADRRARRGDLEPALATIQEIHERNPSFKGVSEAAGDVIDRIITQAVEGQDWRRARHFINRLRGMYAGHAVAENWTNDLNSRAEQLLARAEQARGQGEHALASASAESAASIWPQARNLRTRHRLYVERYQRLHVGVLDLPSAGFGDPVLATRADRRSQHLQTLRLFHVDNANDGSAHYSSRSCDRWEPLNLGREAVFELRSSRQPWEMQPIVTAPAIAAHLARRLDPEDPEYDERLAGYARSVEVNSPYEFSIRFHRVPVRTEALLTIPLEPQPVDEELVLLDEDESPVSTGAPPPRGGFDLVETTEQEAVYQRAMPEPEGQRLYRLVEIRERRYEDFPRLYQGLLRGDIVMAPSLPPRYIDRLRNDEELAKALFIQKMALPSTHVIQINPRSRPLNNSEFRRALMYGVDRRTILSDTILEGASADLARLVTGPFPSQSYANSALAAQREYDTVSTIALSLAARKQLGGTLPPLKMVVVDEPLVRAAAEKIIAGWKLFGIEVTIVPAPTRLVPDNPGSVEWDLLYRTVQMVEPVVDLWPFLTLTRRAQVSDLNPFPDWLRQEIIDLDLIGDWGQAVQATSRLHQHLWAEVLLIPLWEVDEYLVYRKNIRGVPVSPVNVYDQVDRWVVEAWYPAEEP